MALPLFQNRRLTERKIASGHLPGKSSYQNSINEWVEFRLTPKDVSRDGMGFISTSELEVGTVVLLEIADQKIELKITWQQPGFSKKDSFRYGCVTQDHRVDLEEIFAQHKCLIG